MLWKDEGLNVEDGRVVGLGGGGKRGRGGKARTLWCARCGGLIARTENNDHNNSTKVRKDVATPPGHLAPTNGVMVRLIPAVDLMKVGKDGVGQTTSVASQRRRGVGLAVAGQAMGGPEARLDCS